MSVPALKELTLLLDTDQPSLPPGWRLVQEHEPSDVKDGTRVRVYAHDPKRLLVATLHGAFCPTEFLEASGVLLRAQPTSYLEAKEFITQMVYTLPDVGDVLATGWEGEAEEGEWVGEGVWMAKQPTQPASDEAALWQASQPPPDMDSEAALWAASQPPPDMDNEAALWAASQPPPEADDEAALWQVSQPPPEADDEAALWAASQPPPEPDSEAALWMASQPPEEVSEPDQLPSPHGPQAAAQGKGTADSAHTAANTAEDLGAQLGQLNVSGAVQAGSSAQQQQSSHPSPAHDVQQLLQQQQQPHTPAAQQTQQQQQQSRPPAAQPAKKAMEGGDAAKALAACFPSHLVTAITALHTYELYASYTEDKLPEADRADALALLGGILRSRQLRDARTDARAALLQLAADEAARAAARATRAAAQRPPPQRGGGGGGSLWGFLGDAVAAAASYAGGDADAGGGAGGGAGAPYAVLLTGHAVGGLFAELVAAAEGIPAVTFESPGAVSLVAAANSGVVPAHRLPFQEDRAEDSVVGFLSSPNIVNTNDAHVGRTYRLYLPHVTNAGGQLWHVLRCASSSVARVGAYAAGAGVVLAAGAAVAVGSLAGATTVVVSGAVAMGARGITMSGLNAFMGWFGQEAANLKRQHALDRIIEAAFEPDGYPRELGVVRGWPRGWQKGAWLGQLTQPGELLSEAGKQLQPFRKGNTGLRYALDADAMHEHQAEQMEGYEVQRVGRLDAVDIVRREMARLIRQAAAQAQA